MDYTLISRRTELQMEARRRGVPVETVAAELQQAINQRLGIPMTMRAQA